MKQNWALVLLVSGLALGAAATRAQDKAQQPLTVTLDAADCRRLVARSDAAGIEHRPRPDVEYRPGRDVDSKGRPIAPADLPSANPLPLTGPLTLPLAMRLEDLLGSRAPADLEKSEIGVAQVTIDAMTGRLSFNGQPLERPAEDAIAKACREYLARQGKTR